MERQEIRMATEYGFDRTFYIDVTDGAFCVSELDPDFGCFTFLGTFETAEKAKTAIINECR